MSQQPSAFLVMPSRTAPKNLDVAKALFFPAEKRPVVVRGGRNSILTRNFNDGLCMALQARRRGLDIQWFGMLHDDVQPKTEWWLDVLIDTLESGNYDVVSTIVAIKDWRGVSSTGIGHADEAQRWHPRLRFTFHELATMPTTFTAADVGYPDSPLLVNTGCWVARLDSLAMWVRHGGCFRNEDRIVVNRDGDHFAECVSEDWRASRDWHALGFRVAATRAVVATHWGDAPYRNDIAWGRYEHDENTRPVAEQSEELCVSS